MVEKKEIKTKKELEMEKAEKDVPVSKSTEPEEVKVEEVEKLPDEPEAETEPESERKSEWEAKAERGRGAAQKFFDDMIGTFRERGGDFEKALSEYTASAPSKLATDVIETDGNIIVKADIPGVKKEDIVIDLTDDSIEIFAKFEEETEEEGKNFIKKERRYGEARRSLILPEAVKVKEASAKFDNGVLTVTLPKLEEKKRFQVKVD
ncbi:Hsp20/alpha crystallin family protein [Methanobacterium sp.]|jgi:HSP20 family protein|uniref:Hsp20/alpha crystallin family protein n=1 Tax=Methanobacterium sp. TaxID=2164 RepID=UPI0031598A8C